VAVRVHLVVRCDARDRGIARIGDGVEEGRQGRYVCTHCRVRACERELWLRKQTLCRARVYVCTLVRLFVFFVTRRGSSFFGRGTPRTRRKMPLSEHPPKYYANVQNIIGERPGNRSEEARFPRRRLDFPRVLIFLSFYRQCPPPAKTAGRETKNTSSISRKEKGTTISL